MKTCAEIDRLLTPYIDGQAALDDASAVEEHVAACGPCREQADAERAGRTVIRGRADELRAPASASLHARCRAAVATPFSAAGTRTATAVGAAFQRRRMPLSIAAAAIFVIAGSLVFLWLRGDSGTLLAAELALDHVKCFALTDVDAAAADPLAVAQSFEQASGWPVDVPASVESEQLELLTARQCVYHDGQMAHVLYRLRGQPMSLFVLPQRAHRGRAVNAVGHQAVMWGLRGQTYAVVGQEDSATLQRIASYVRTGNVLVR